jgi:hypothetical protein
LAIDSDRIIRLTLSIKPLVVTDSNKRSDPTDGSLVRTS